MARRWTRVAAAAAMAAGAAVAGAASAQAAEPIVLGSCATTVTGAPGQPVSLSPGAVAAPVVDLVRALPGGFLLAEPADSAIRALPPIPLGAVPAGGGQVISGGQVAQAVVARLHGIPLLGPVIAQLSTRTSDLLTGMCGITLHAVNAAVAPVQDGAKAVADAAKQVVGPGPGGDQQPAPKQPPPQQPQQPKPGTPGGRSVPDGPVAQQPPPQAAPGGAGDERKAAPPDPTHSDLVRSGLARWDFGRPSLRDHSGLPSDLWSSSRDARGSGPGLSPRRDGDGAGHSTDDSATRAGRADALPASPLGRVGTPVVLAVLSLAVVTAGLVRRLAQRRALD
ncbi:hypothetical protein [Streptoalloteichus hindustanus]|uniref:Uncharacterized protein n=1 Tax=Streptoalloteichus hindustanus TaxID=2017 RepID=A0A1M4UY27_STRHI|nr:hypothetical protein [Streptoalloteichus hindustanus]SHE61569.1 hypothetical protein SAMN05444320_101576 [Streptoalloteichus hindustanus]